MGKACGIISPLNDFLPHSKGENCLSEGLGLLCDQVDITSTKIVHNIMPLPVSTALELLINTAYNIFTLYAMAKHAESWQGFLRHHPNILLARV